jgi:hypothetical protein
LAIAAIPPVSTQGPGYKHGLRLAVKVNLKLPLGIMGDYMVHRGSYDDNG